MYVLSIFELGCALCDITFLFIILLFATGRVVLVTGCDTGIGHEVEYKIILDYFY